MPTYTPVLEMRGISKLFPGVQALKSVNLTVYPNEVLVVIGENGAGKSTLMKILGGIYHADEGSIKIFGKEVVVRNVSHSIELGIGFIHQELNFLENIDVAGNIFLGREPRWAGPLRLINYMKLKTITRPWLKLLGLEVSPDVPMSSLSIAQQQMVEIAKALSLKASILIMDEPTSSLTLSETKRLFEVIRDLKNKGVSIIYISHRLTEVKEIADRVVVLKDGANAGELSREEINHDNMVKLMVGRYFEDSYVSNTTSTRTGETCFQVEKLRTTTYPDCEISFVGECGEILGFAGLVGAGRSEMAQAIFGADYKLGGTIKLDGQRLQINSSRDAIENGIYLVPEDRRTSGLVTGMNVRENITLSSLDRYSVGGLIRRGRETKTANRQCKSLKIKAPSVETVVKNLSGGNQQKVVLSKWLVSEPKVIIFDEPTRGIDVGAKAEIHKLMRNLAENGVVVIMISSDMEEIQCMSDRIVVMHEGDITGIINQEEFDEETVMRLAVGQKETTLK